MATARHTRTEEPNKARQSTHALTGAEGTPPRKTATRAQQLVGSAEVRRSELAKRRIRKFCP